MGEDARKHIVFIPGLNTSASAWNDLVGYLPTSIEAHALDCPPLDDVEKIAATLLSQLPERFVLCGFSFGGYVALSMIAQAPERVGRLILVGTNDGVDSELMKAERHKSAARAAHGGYARLIAKQMEWLIHPDNFAREELRASVTDSALEYGAERFIAHMQACARRPDRSALTRALTIPVLVLTGTADRVMPIERQLAMAHAIPRATFVKIEAAGHMVPLEQPEKMAALICGFVLAA